MATEAIHAGNRTIARAAANAAERYGERTSVRYPEEDGEWRDLTFADVSRIVDEIARGLRALGVGPGDRVSLLANTRPEWTYCSLAISRVGGIVVPVYPTSSPEECEWVVGNSQSRVVMCEDARQVAKIEQVSGRLQELEHIVVIDPDGGQAATSLEELREHGRGGDLAELERRCEAVAPEDPYTIIYTSGTTGPRRASSSATAIAPRLG